MGLPMRPTPMNPTGSAAGLRPCRRCRPGSPADGDPLTERIRAICEELGGATVVATRPAAESLPKPAVTSAAGDAVRAASPAVQLAATARVNAVAPNAVSGRAMFTAAGSVIILADGKVAHATLAQIQPPAPGFVYER